MIQTSDQLNLKRGLSSQTSKHSYRCLPAIQALSLLNRSTWDMVKNVVLLKHAYAFEICTCGG